MSDLTQPEEKGYTAPIIIAAGIPTSKIEATRAGTVKLKANLSIVTRKSTAKPHLKLFEATATDDTGSLRVIWFNQASVEYTNTSKEYVLLGKLEKSRGIKTLVNPIFSPIDDYEKWVNKLGKGQL